MWLTNRDVVIVVDSDQVAELQVTGCGSGFARNTFHGTSVAKEDEGVVVD